MIFNFRKDGKKEFDEDRTEEAKILCEDIENMKININNREEVKSKLLYLYNEFTFGNDSVYKGTLKDFNRLLKSPADSEGKAILSNNWTNIETYQEHNFRTFTNFLMYSNEYDDYALKNREMAENNLYGYIALSSLYNNKEKSLEINNYYDLFSNMNGFLLEIYDFENSLNNDKKEQLKEQLNEIKLNIDNAMKKLIKHIKGNKLKLYESSGRENSEVFNKAINEFNEITSSARMLFRTHAKLNNNNNPDKPSIYENKLNSLNKIDSIKNVNSKLSIKNKNKILKLMKKIIRKTKKIV
eukprot:jgi/Orpsp1_1/1187667/evm.model.d7180000059314.2